MIKEPGKKENTNKSKIKIKVSLYYFICQYLNYVPTKHKQRSKNKNINSSYFQLEINKVSILHKNKHAMPPFISIFSVRL
jgi:hypothetical protein